MIADVTEIVGVAMQKRGRGPKISRVSSFVPYPFLIRLHGLATMT